MVERQVGAVCLQHRFPAEASNCRRQDHTSAATLPDQVESAGMHVTQQKEAGSSGRSCM